MRGASSPASSVLGPPAPRDDAFDRLADLAGGDRRQVGAGRETELVQERGPGGTAAPHGDDDRVRPAGHHLVLGISAAISVPERAVLRGPGVRPQPRRGDHGQDQPPGVRRLELPLPASQRTAWRMLALSRRPLSSSTATARQSRNRKSAASSFPAWSRRSRPRRRPAASTGGGQPWGGGGRVSMHARRVRLTSRERSPRL